MILIGRTDGISMGQHIREPCILPTVLAYQDSDSFGTVADGRLWVHKLERKRTVILTCKEKRGSFTAYECEHMVPGTQG
jgi:hypothetical protein